MSEGCDQDLFRSHPLRLWRAGLITGSLTVPKCAVLQRLEALLEAPGQGLLPLLLQIHQHKDFILQQTEISLPGCYQHVYNTPITLHSATTAAVPEVLCSLNSMATAASHSQLQELMLRLLQLAASRKQCHSTVEAAALALCSLFCDAGSHDFRIGLLLQQRRSSDLVMQSRSSISDSRVWRGLISCIGDTPNDRTMTAVLQADPAMVSSRILNQHWSNFILNDVQTDGLCTQVPVILPVHTVNALSTHTNL